MAKFKKGDTIHSARLTHQGGIYIDTGFVKDVVMQAAYRFETHKSTYRAELHDEYHFLTRKEALVHLEAECQEEIKTAQEEVKTRRANLKVVQKAIKDAE